MIFAGFYSRRCVGDQVPVKEGGGAPAEDRDGAAGARILNPYSSASGHKLPKYMSPSLCVSALETPVA